MSGGQKLNPGAMASQPGLYQAGIGHLIHDDAAKVTKLLRGRWHGHFGAAACPCCQSGGKDQNALTISRSPSGRLLLHCKKSGCDFAAILSAAGLSREVFTPDPLAVLRHEAQARAEAVLRSARARRIWDEAEPSRSTVAEAYLAARGLLLWQHHDCHPRTLRCHPRLLHAPSGQYFPAMIGLVEGGEGFAVHRTYLTASGTKAAVEPVKMMLGATAGGAVRLMQGDPGLLFVAEGIESAMSIPKVWSDHRFDWASVWATLSASGMRSLRLPEKAGVLVTFADGDTAGRSAAAALAERASGCGWQVHIVDCGDGRDANDMLIAGEVTSC